MRPVVMEALDVMGSALAEYWDTEKWLTWEGVFHPEYIDARRRVQEEKRLRRIFSELKRQKAIQTRKKGDNILFALTESGARRFLRARIHTAPQCDAGTSIVIIFDIPETEKRIRQHLRRFLAEHGFEQLQKSVWSTEKEIFAELKHFLEMSGAAPWVQIFRASHLFGHHRSS